MNTADGSGRSPSIEAGRPGDLIGIQWLLDLESLPIADRMLLDISADDHGRGVF